MTSAVGIQLRHAPNELVLSYEDGSVVALPAEFLRVHSPEAVARRELLPRKRSVRLVEVKPVGIFALRLTFSDGYNGGEYSWDYLFQLGREQKVHWRRYLHRLEQAGLSRE